MQDLYQQPWGGYVWVVFPRALWGLYYEGLYYIVPVSRTFTERQGFRFHLYWNALESSSVRFKLGSSASRDQQWETTRPKGSKYQYSRFLVVTWGRSVYTARLHGPCVKRSRRSNGDSLEIIMPIVPVARRLLGLKAFIALWLSRLAGPLLAIFSVRLSCVQYVAAWVRHGFWSLFPKLSNRVHNCMQHGWRRT